MIDGLWQKIARQERIIKDMTEFIARQDTDEDICMKQVYKMEFGECYGEDGEKMDCIDCIIKYFEEGARENE
jgi:hypothetical protein